MSANLIHNHFLQQNDGTLVDTSKKGDFIGFEYNGKHSSELGIVRISDGSRFNENLLPTMQDKTVQVPGADGTYYFGSYYPQRQFNISFAFDNLTEFQVAQLKSHFGDKGIHDLIFDETPYKVYSAKVTGTATIKYIAFSEGPTNRIYRGEGSIQFTCYNPFARSKYKFLHQYEDEDYPNKDEWVEASGIRLQYDGSTLLDQYDISTNSFTIYNPGDQEADWILKIPVMTDLRDITIARHGIGGLEKLAIKDCPINSDASFLIINSKTNLVYTSTATGEMLEILNGCISDGNFFKFIKSPANATQELVLNFEPSIDWASNNRPILEYNYHYY